MLKAIMAVSADGFVCTGPFDDMKWTGAEDKAIFRGETMGAIVGVGSTTAMYLPKLRGRTTIVLTREAEDELPLIADGARMTLGAFYQNVPEGWLIGGQTVLLSAIRERFVDRIILSHVRTEVGGGLPDEITPELHRRGWTSRLFPQETLSLVTWNAPHGS